MRWKITIEDMDEFDGRDGAEMVIEKEFGRLCQFTSYCQKFPVRACRGPLILRISKHISVIGYLIEKSFVSRGGAGESLKRLKIVGW